MKSIYKVKYDPTFFLQADETWIDIPGYEGYYQFSNKYKLRALPRRINCAYGRTRVASGQFKKMVICSDHYPSYHLGKDNKQEILKVHILVAAIAHLNPERKKEVNHKDGDKTNFSYTNLEWATSAENKKHAWGMGLMRARDMKAGKNPRAKLDFLKAKAIRDLFDSGNYYKSDLGKIFGVDSSVIADIINGKTWVENE